MKKYILFIIMALVLVALVIFVMNSNISRQQSSNSPTPSSTITVGVLDPKNGTYEIEGESVVLKNGLSETQNTPGSDNVTTTEYFGNEVYDDFNGDGKEDAVFILSQDTGGSGIFFYVATLLDNGGVGIGTNAIFLGDRISPESMEFQNDMIVVNYADRKPGEPYSTEPSVGVTKYLKVVNNKLVEIEPE